MSAESHQKRTPSASSSENVRLVPNIVPPQPVSDRSILDSVAGFINDVALTNVPQSNPKDAILWVKFENLADISDTCLGEDWDIEGNLPPPLLLCIGYATGIQVWAVPANGEAIEVMSWKHGSVNILRILPTPFLSNNSELANDLLDQFIHKRPLMALCGDCPIPNQAPVTSSQQLHAVNFVSLKDGDLVKTIKFKSPIVDIVANRISIAITFYERIAIFDARTLEDRLTVTTCYPCPNGLCPIALGDRWLAYAERKLIPSKTSAGGCFADGIPSYTATVLNAAKSLGKGLRELGEQVAAGLAGSSAAMQQNPSVLTAVDGTQAGIVTILDIKHPIKDISPTTGTPVAINGSDPIIAHFMAHTEAVIAMSFDPSGMLLLTADRRGHDFNVFRIQPHPCGSVLAAVHHLYVLHRGDTSAKVQDIAFSFDSRWVAVSTLRGTTHVFPITPYGGQCGFRTHSSPHVVNRLSRFHRSAGLPVDGRSSSPILMAEHAVQSTAYANPRLPPFPHPTVVLPLAQLRQPSSLNSTTTLMSVAGGTAQSSSKSTTGRTRHHSAEESHTKPLRVAAVFAKARSWLLEPPGMHETPARLHRRAVDSLFVIAGHGALIQYDLEPRHASNIPKEKICDESPIELEVEAKAQWILGQKSNSQLEISPPLPADNWLIKDRVIDNNLNLDTSQIENLRTDDRDDRWLSQVEIVTHAGPHRRLWMGPQFVFKLYHTPSGHSLAHIDMESVEVGARTRSTPVNMPSNLTTSARPLVPVLIESGSCSSHEQSPRLLDSFHYESTDSEIVSGPDSQLKEDLADAMRDCAPIARDAATCDKMGRDNETIITDEASSVHTVVVSVVNPQGIITQVKDNESQNLEFVEKFDDNYILENCDETMFRPVVTVMSDPSKQVISDELSIEECSKPVEMPLELVVPVIDEKVMEEKRRQKEEKIKKEQEAAKKLKEEMKDNGKKGKKGQKNNKKAFENDKKSNVTQKSSIDELKVEKLPIKMEDESVTCNKKDIIDSKDNETVVDVEKSHNIKEIKAINIEDMKEAQIEVKCEAECEKLSEIPEIEVEKATKVLSASLEKTKEEEKVVIMPPKVEEKEETKNEWDFSSSKIETVEEFPSLLNEPQTVTKKNESKKKKKNQKYQDRKLSDANISPDDSETLHKSSDSDSTPSEQPSALQAISFSQVMQTIDSSKPQKVETIELPKPIAAVIETPVKSDSWKRNKKNKKGQKSQEKTSPIFDLPPLEPPPPLPSSFDNDDHCEIDQDAILKISKHETIGDDEIEIVPHEEIQVIQDSPKKNEETFIKNEDFYDIDDELPPLEPFEPFDIAPEEEEEDIKEEEIIDEEENNSEKQEMKKKMSELLKDTNMVFAMCSSLKEIKSDEESKSMSSSSHIQRSTSSSLTTNTTTATFASASSQQIGEGLDSDYKSLDLELEEAAATAPAQESEFKIPLAITKSSSIDKDDAEVEDISSFEATSSETDADDSSKKSNLATKFKREDDEELRPLLLETSTTSLTLPVSSGSNILTTEANETTTLPESNQKSQATSNNNNNGKRKNKKKRR